jgi:hypothetical protein
MNMRALTCRAAAGGIALIVQQLPYAVQHLLAACGHALGHSLERFFALGVVQRFTPFHLLEEEILGHRGVVLGVDRRATQLAQVGCALERVLQALVGLVDAHGPLQRRALGRVALGGETVRVCFALQLFPALVDLGAVLRESLGQAEQFEVAGAQVHVRRGSFLRSRSGRARWGC